ncbi:MAG: tetratricopeptide repeat protein [Proteobacteria bacterium]|nr:tetratricopeptide repeat protein [Pseudomonadota bacterium]
MSAVARRYYQRGRQALDRGDLEAAMDSFHSALALTADFSSARIGYAVALSRFGDTPRAAQTLRAGLARPATAVATAALWATLGDVLTAGGDFFGAEDAFAQAASEPSFVARASSGLARVYGKLGRYPEAVAQLGRAAALARAAQRESPE